jgi:hypothetical protein
MTIGRRGKWLVLAAVIVANLFVFALVRFRLTAHRGGPGMGLRPVKPIEARLRLVEALRGETVLESIDRLPNFDDTVWVAGDIEPDTALSQRSYRYQRQFIPSLNRVRKILGQLDREKAGVEAAKGRLMSLLAEATNGFGDVRRAKLQQISGSDHGVVLSEPDNYWASMVNGPAAAYLLSELNAREALPAFTKLLSAPGEQPINRVFLFFAAHRLVASHPADALSPESTRLLDQYKSLAAGLPAIEMRDILSWDSPFEIDDVRFIMLRRDVPELRTDKRQVPSYPADLTKFDTEDGGRHPELDRYIATMCVFVESVYGN